MKTIFTLAMVAGLMLTASGQFGTLDTTFNDPQGMVECQFEAYNGDPYYSINRGNVVRIGANNNYYINKEITTWNAGLGADVSASVIEKFDSNGSFVLNSDLLEGSTSYNLIDFEVLNDQSVVAIGTHYQNNFANIVITKLTPSLAYDTNFGYQGRIFIMENRTGFASGIEVLPNGQFLAGGTLEYTSNSNLDLVTVRINANGSIDSTYGLNGFGVYNSGTNFEYMTAMASQSDGKVVCVGYISTSGAGYDAGLIRFNTNGTIDTTFGSNANGSTYYNMLNNNHDYGMTIGISPTDDIVITVIDGQRSLERVLKFNPDATTHTLVRQTDAAGGVEFIDFAHARFLQNGKLMIAGRDDQQSTIWLYDLNNNLDTLLNGNGKNTLLYNDGMLPQTSIFLDFLEQDDHKIVLSGYLKLGNPQVEQRAMLVRLNHKQVLSIPVDTTDTLVDDSTIGIKPTMAYRIDVYPNPAQNELNISIPASSLPSDLVLYNVNGSIVLRQIIKMEDTQIDMPDASGFYLLEVSGKEGVVRKKIIRQ